VDIRRLTSLRNKDDSMTDLSMSMYKWKCRTSSYFPRTLLLKATICVFSIQGISKRKMTFLLGLRLEKVFCQYIPAQVTTQGLRPSMETTSGPGSCLIVMNLFFSLRIS
jgi:hypothetical protein